MPGVAQLRTISLRMSLQGLALLQGGWVAGETWMQRLTRADEASRPISARQERVGVVVAAPAVPAQSEAAIAKPNFMPIILSRLARSTPAG